MSGMPPLTVAILNGGRPAVSEKIKRRLAKRGFRVQLQREGSGTLPAGCDMLLIHCRRADPDRVVSQLEDLWTRRWAAWYEVTKRRKGHAH